MYANGDTAASIWVAVVHMDGAYVAAACSSTCSFTSKQDINKYKKPI